MSTRSFKPALMAAALCLGIAGSASAQDGSLAALLNNGNGQITSAQAEVAARVQFNNLDTNHDGVISEAEFVADRMKLFQAADTNGDGVVTRAEVRALMISKMQNRTAALGQ